MAWRCRLRLLHDLGPPRRAPYMIFSIPMNPYGHPTANAAKNALISKKSVNPSPFKSASASPAVNAPKNAEISKKSTSPSPVRSAGHAAPVPVSNTYAEPELLAKGAPTATTPLAMAMEEPKSSPAPPSVGRSFSICAPVAASKRYAEPESKPLSSS